MHMFNQPQNYSIYRSIEDARAPDRALGQLAAYQHAAKHFNYVLNNIVSRVLEAQAIMTFWDGQVPNDKPGNQPQDVYEEHNRKLQLD